MAIALFELAVATIVVLETGSLAGISGLTVAPLLIVTLTRSAESEKRVDGARINWLRWNGLQPHGSIDPEPDRWMSLAALPDWTVAALAVLIAATFAAVIVGAILLITT